jgi:AP-1 complex subunit mu
MAAGCSAIFMLDLKGKILIARNYRGDVPMACAERFIAKIMEEEEVNLRPVVEEDGITYIYIKSNNVYRMSRVPTPT